MSVGEALTNIVWAEVSGLGDIRCSANWMWAPKLPGEGARLYDAAVAMRDVMIEFGMAVDGGKDSLSMAAKVTNPDGSHETVKSPGTLVISAYATCPDITKTVTPDIKMPGKSRLLFIGLGAGRNRLGGSALAQVFGQAGDRSPDLDDPQLSTKNVPTPYRGSSPINWFSPDMTDPTAASRPRCWRWPLQQLRHRDRPR
jgi:phosphoribosylformylglycinamidine synthase